MLSIPPESLHRLIMDISALHAGYAVAVQVLSMWMHSAKESREPLDEHLIQCGRNLSQLGFQRCRSQSNVRLSFR
jgi:hypothetical protein